MSSNNSTANFLDQISKTQDKRPPLTFAEFSNVNMHRHLVWPRTTDVIEEWSLGDWAIAAMEEAGEICGAIKRLNRVAAGHIIHKKDNPDPVTKEEALLAIKKEIGDTITYLDLLAQEGLGTTLEECVRLAFNGVSERQGMEHRI